MKFNLQDQDNNLIHALRVARALIEGREAWLEREKTLYVDRLTQQQQTRLPEADLDVLNELEDERFQLAAHGLQWEALTREIQAVILGYEQARRAGDGRSHHIVEITVRPARSSFEDPQR